MTIKYWTGTGSKNVPEHIAKFQEELGEMMGNLRYVLRSSGVDGSDLNFQRGVCKVDPKLCEIHLPWPNYNINHREPEFEGSRYVSLDTYRQDLAGMYLKDNVMPWYRNMRAGLQKLHARNYYKIFGTNDVLPEFVVYYAKTTILGEIDCDCKSSVITAKNEGIPTFNLYRDNQVADLLRLLKKISKK